MIMSIRLREYFSFLAGWAGRLMCVDRITDSWAEKYGYSSAKEFEENAQKKFSLIETGVMDQPNTRLLLLNVSGFFFHVGVMG